MLTDFEKSELYQKDAQTCMEIMHICADNLGAMSMDNYCKATCKSKRTIYDQISRNKITVFRIDNHVFPCINV